MGGQGQQDILPTTRGRLLEQRHLGDERPGHREHSGVCEGARDDRLSGEAGS